MTDPLVSFVRALQRVESDLSVDEVMDIVWLALQMNQAVAGPTAPAAAPTPGPRRPEAVSSDASPLPPSRAGAGPEVAVAPEVPPAALPADNGSAALYQSLGSSATAAAGLPFRTPAAPALPGKRELLRALRPLVRRGASSHRQQLHLPATVQRIADEGLWLPCLRPALERWFQVAVLIERSASMGIWQKLAAEFHHMLESAGAFSAVRGYQLVSGEPPALYPLQAPLDGGRKPLSLSQLRDPRGRTLVLVVTDCVSAGWSDGGMAWFLRELAHVGPVALVQVFPGSLLDRTALGEAPPLWLHAALPGAANAKLQAVPQDGFPAGPVDLAGYFKLPVLTLEPQALAAWARMLGATAGVWVSGCALRLPSALRATGTAAAAPPTEVVPEATPSGSSAPSPEERVGAFRLSASPLARQLARLMTVFHGSGFSLPILRLVRQALLPQARTHHEAEVLLSGLLETLPESAEFILRDPERVLYDFVAAVPELLETMPQVLQQGQPPDKRRVLEALTRYVAQQFGSTRDFMAVVSTLSGMGRGQTAFAQLSVDLLRSLGGSYAALATDGSARVIEWSAPGHPQRNRVELAAYLGDPLAASLVQGPAPGESLALDRWLLGLRRWGTLVLADAALFLAEYLSCHATAGLLPEFLLQTLWLTRCGRLCMTDPSAESLGTALDAVRNADQSRLDSGRARAVLQVCRDATLAAALPWLDEQPHGDRLQQLVLAVLEATQRELHVAAPTLRAALSAHLRKQLFDPSSYLPSAQRSLGKKVLIVGDLGKLSDLLRDTAAALGRMVAAAGYDLLMGGVAGVERAALRSYVAERERTARPSEHLRIPPLVEGPQSAISLLTRLQSTEGPIRSDSGSYLADVTIVLGETLYVSWLARQQLKADEPVVPIPWTGDQTQQVFKQLWDDRDRYGALDGRRLGFIDSWWVPDSTVGEQTQRVVQVLDASLSLQTQRQYRQFALHMLRLLVLAADRPESLLAGSRWHAYAASLAAAAYRPELTLDQLSPAEYSRPGQTESELLPAHLGAVAAYVTRLPREESHAHILHHLAALLPAMRGWLAFDFANIAELIDLDTTVSSELVAWLVPLVSEYAWPLARSSLLSAQFRRPALLHSLTTLLGVVRQAHASDSRYRQEILEIAAAWAQMYLQIVRSELGEARLSLIVTWLQDSAIEVDAELLAELTTDRSPETRIVGYLLLHSHDLLIPEELAERCLSRETQLVATHGEARPHTILVEGLARALVRNPQAYRRLHEELARQIRQAQPAAVPLEPTPRNLSDQQSAASPRGPGDPVPSATRPDVPSDSAAAPPPHFCAPDSGADAAPEGYFTVYLAGSQALARAFFHEATFVDSGTFFDTLYMSYLSRRYEPYTYGSDWVLVNTETDRILIPWGWLCSTYKGDFTLDRDWKSAAWLREAGLVAGSSWRIMPSDLSAYGVAVDENLHYLVALQDKRKLATLAAKEILTESAPEPSDPEVYNYTAIFHSPGSTPLGIGEHRAWKQRPTLGVAARTALFAAASAHPGAATGDRLVAELTGHRARIWSAAFSPDGRHIVTASEDRTVRLWEAGSGRLVYAISHNEFGVYSATFSPDGQHLVTASLDWTARVYTTEGGWAVAEHHGHGARVWSATFSPDGRHVVTASEDRTGRIWEAASGQLVAELAGHAASVRSATFSPDCRHVVTTSEDKTARVWEAADGRLVAELRGHGASVWSATYSPDGRCIVTASADQTARVWEAASGRLRVELKGHAASVSSATYSPDGRHILTASWDRTARVWETLEGRLVAELMGHTARVSRATYSPDGRRIVTASWDRTARIWDATDGRVLAALTGHQARVWSAMYSPDGQHIVTASDDHTARVWEAAGEPLPDALGER